MYDTSIAEKVYDDFGIHIGYVFELTTDQWLPLNLAGNNYSGPSHHDDAKNIVKIKYANNESSVNE